MDMIFEIEELIGRIGSREIRFYRVSYLDCVLYVDGKVRLGDLIRCLLDIETVFFPKLDDVKKGFKLTVNLETIDEGCHRIHTPYGNLFVGDEHQIESVARLLRVMMENVRSALKKENP